MLLVFYCIVIGQRGNMVEMIHVACGCALPSLWLPYAQNCPHSVCIINLLIWSLCVDGQTDVLIRVRTSLSYLNKISS